MFIETLERRRALSVTVVEGYPGFFEIHGDAEANVINVTVDMNAHTFALNGRTYQNVDYISAWGYDGNDQILISTSSGYSSISTGIHGGDGDDRLSLNYDGGIWGDGGNDYISLRDSFRGDVWLGQGNDFAVLNGANIEAVVRGEEGNDTINAAGNSYGVALYGGSGDDLIFGSPLADYLHGGTGVDTIHGIGGQDTMYGGQGNDQFNVSSTQTSGVYIIGGDGYDIVDVQGEPTVWTYDIEEIF